MRKWLIIWLAVLGAVAVALTTLQVFGVRDGMYEGEPLEFWLRGGQPSPQYLLQTNWSQQKAEEAVRHLGTKAIPVLLGKLRATDSKLKLYLVALAQKQRLVRLDPNHSIRSNIAGYEGFKILGSAGGAATPGLVRIVEENRSLSSRCYSIGALGYVGPEATSAIPSLLKWLADTNATIRWNTALTLGRIHAEPEVVVPALVALLDDRDNWVRHDAIDALGAFGPQAASAAPFLNHRLDDPTVASEVRAALRRILLNTDFGAPTNVQPYHVRAGGPRSFVLLTNAPASNRVAISFASWSDSGPVFRITNREPHAILLWNVRVQTPAADGGTDGLGWDTVYDDYPMGTDTYNSPLYPPGSTGEFKVRYPGKAPWRVCVLYSTDWTDSGKNYSGNYEVIGQELKE